MITASQAKEIATVWLSDFDSAVTSADTDALVSIILPTGSLRDLLLFSWDVRTLHGVADIKEYLSDKLVTARITDVKLDESFHLAPSASSIFGGPSFCVEAAFTFEALYGHGRGYVRLLDNGNGNWHAFALFTSLSDLRGYEEATGPEPSSDPERPWLSWQEIQDRKKAEIERDPYVVISMSSRGNISLVVMTSTLSWWWSEWSYDRCSVQEDEYTCHCYRKDRAHWRRLEESISYIGFAYSPRASHMYA